MLLLKTFFQVFRSWSDLYMCFRLRRQFTFSRLQLRLHESPKNLNLLHYLLNRILFFFDTSVTLTGVCRKLRFFNMYGWFLLFASSGLKTGQAAASIMLQKGKIRFLLPSIEWWIFRLSYNTQLNSWTFNNKFWPKYKNLYPSQLILSQ